MSLLVVHNLSQRFGKKEIVKGVSFHANAGEVVAFLGPNGAGKTTLLRTVCGLLAAPTYFKPGRTNGIFFENHLVNNLTIAQRVEQGLVYLPQHTTLFLDLTVHENLLLIYQYHTYWRTLVPTNNARAESSIKKWYDPILRWFSHKERARLFDEEMMRWLERTNLIKTLDQKAGSLSGGQKRKLEVVRTLLMHPKMILLDEPFAGVDPKSIYELKEIFVDLAKDGMGVLISDHHVDQLLSIAQLIYVMLDGTIVASGGIESIMSNEYTKEMYLGGQFYDEMVKRFITSPTK